MCDVVVEPLTGDRITRCRGKPIGAEDRADDRRGREEVVQSLDGDPTADREQDKGEDACL